MNEFYNGDTVEFTSKKRGETFTGVVTKVGAKRRGHRRYTVETKTGETYTVPGVMLTAVKIDAAEAQALLEKGAEKAEARSEAKEKRQAKRAKSLSPYTEGLRSGMTVEVFAKQRWATARVGRVDAEKGKVTVTNPLYDLVQKVGPLPNGRRVQKTITVNANKVRHAG